MKQQRNSESFILIIIYLVFILFVILFTSCSKPRDLQKGMMGMAAKKKYVTSNKGSGQVQYFITSAYNRDTVRGVSTTMLIENLGGGATKSAWLSIYGHCADGTIFWLQTGYQNWGNTPSFVILGFSGGHIGMPSQPIMLAGNPILKRGTYGTWSIYLDNAGSLYVSFDGVPICRYDLNVQFLEFTEIAIECGGSTSPANFPTITFSPAMMHNKNGVWFAGATAFSEGSGYGAEGHEQNAQLPTNVVRMGTKIKQPLKQVLWK